MKRRIHSDAFIPVRFDSFFSAAIWDSGRNNDTRFMRCIYVEHTRVSRENRGVSKNKSAGLESVLLATRKLCVEEMHFNFQVILRRFAKEFRMPFVGCSW
jgi:hypothetical protein